jgi:hypothetical protein
MDIPPTVLTSFPWSHGQCKSNHGPVPFRGLWTSVLEDGGPVPWNGNKGEKVHVWLREQPRDVCLGFPYKVKKFDSNRPFLAAIETA